MSDTDDKENDLNRSVVEFKVQYNIGVHTKGRKKEQMQVKEDTFDRHHLSCSFALFQKFINSSNDFPLSEVRFCCFAICFTALNRRSNLSILFARVYFGSSFKKMQSEKAACNKSPISSCNLFLT